MSKLFKESSYMMRLGNEDYFNMFMLYGECDTCDNLHD